ncbi:unnamed protein product [Lathyrus oleraceus]
MEEEIPQKRKKNPSPLHCLRSYSFLFICVLLSFSTTAFACRLRQLLSFMLLSCIFELVLQQLMQFGFGVSDLPLMALGSSFGLRFCELRFYLASVAAVVSSLSCYGICVAAAFCCLSYAAHFNSLSFCKLVVVAAFFNLRFAHGLSCVWCELLLAFQFVAPLF